MLLFVSLPAQTFVPWAPVSTAGEPPKPREIEDTDHDEVRLRVGVGYLGRFDAPLGRAREAEPVHMLGIRFWFRRSVGLDVGLGAGARFGNDDSATGPSAVALAARVSLPVALVVTKHLTLFVAPTVAFGWAGATVPGRTEISPITALPRTPPDARHQGTRLAVGARIGGELQLGFISAARLSLTGTVGLDADWRRGSTRAAAEPTTRDPEPQAVTSTSSQISIRTAFADDPWAAVLGNVALLAYF